MEEEESCRNKKLRRNRRKQEEEKGGKVGREREIARGKISGKTKKSCSFLYNFKEHFHENVKS